LHPLFLIVALFVGDSTASRDTLIVSVESIVKRIDSIDRRLGDNFKIFCGFEDSKKLVEVTDTSNWPEEANITYNVILDSVGGIVRFDEIPASESGDWYVTLTSYFSSSGRIIKFNYYKCTDGSECTKLLRESRLQYFDANGKQVASQRCFEDENFKRIDTVGCYMWDPIEEHPYKSTREVKKKLHIK
jgi:hypothetical protein